MAPGSIKIAGALAAAVVVVAVLYMLGRALYYVGMAICDRLKPGKAANDKLMEALEEEREKVFCDEEISVAFRKVASDADLNQDSLHRAIGIVNDVFERWTKLLSALENWENELGETYNAVLAANNAIAKIETIPKFFSLYVKRSEYKETMKKLVHETSSQFTNVLVELNCVTEGREAFMKVLEKEMELDPFERFQPAMLKTSGQIVILKRHIRRFLEFLRTDSGVAELGLTFEEEFDRECERQNITRTAEINDLLEVSNDSASVERLIRG
jgi:hypothetical protein